MQLDNDKLFIYLFFLNKKIIYFFILNLIRNSFPLFLKSKQPLMAEIDLEIKNSYTSGIVHKFCICKILY